MRAVIAVIIGAVLLLIGLGVTRSFAAFLMLAAAFAAVRWLTQRELGGQTGDVAGSLEQVSEIVVLLAATAGRV
jgi:adenosylcobinamide-GDP ribazoletransferase